MRRAARFLTPPAILFALLPMRGQEPVKEAVAQAKALWTGSGDREGALAKFEMVFAALEPKARTLEGESLQLLCETYVWLAILDDRVPEKRPQAAKRLEALVDLAPDYDIDRTLATSRLAAVFDGLRSSRLGIVNLTFQPEGGSLRIDGKVASTAATMRMTPGSHQIIYTLPGFAAQEVSATVAAGATTTADFKLNRTSTTLVIHAHPSGAEVLLDGRSLGRTSGKAGSEMAPHAEALALKAEDLSAAFVVGEVKAGKHILELRADCFKPLRVEIDEKYTMPFADHTLTPMKLQPSKGSLSVTSPSSPGELFLNGQSHGPLPVAQLPLCSGTYDLVVRYAAGGYAERVTVPEDKSVSVIARPKPRLAVLGIEGSEEFTGRAQLAQALAGLAPRILEVACLPSKESETPAEALVRYQASKEAELTLLVRPVRGPGGTQVELVLSTLDGEEQRFLDRPLDKDPLADLVSRLNQALILKEPGLGILLIDVGGLESGPYVLSGDPLVMKEGLRPYRAISSINGKPVPTVQAVRQVLQEQVGKSLQVTQMGVPSELPVESSPLEIPLNSVDLAYPFVLADLRLKAQAAQGDSLATLKLNQAIAFMHFRKFDKALELLRSARFSLSRGVGNGTVHYYSGLCLLRLGSVYTPEAIQSFNEALKHPLATLFGPDGPLVAPLARQALEDLKP